MTTAGEIPFPDPMGERDSIYTLHSEVRTLPRQPRRARVRLPPVADARRPRARCTSCAARPAEEIAALRPEPPSPRTYSAQHVEVRGERDGRGRRGRRDRPDRAARGLGPGRRDRLHGVRRRGRGRAAATRAGAFAARGACPPERCLDFEDLAAELEPRGLHVRRSRPRKARLPHEGRRSHGDQGRRVPRRPDARRRARARRRRPRGRRPAAAPARARRSRTPRYVEQGATIVPDADAVFDEAR